MNPIIKRAAIGELEDGIKTSDHVRAYVQALEQEAQSHSQAADDLRTAYNQVLSSLQLSRDAGADVLPMVVEEEGRTVAVIGIDAVTYDNANDTEIPVVLSVVHADLVKMKERRFKYKLIEDNEEDGA